MVLKVGAYWCTMIGHALKECIQFNHILGQLENHKLPIHVILIALSGHPNLTNFYVIKIINFGISL